MRLLLHTNHQEVTITMKRWMMMTIAAIAVFALFGCNGGTQEPPADSTTAPAEGGATTGDKASEPSTTTDMSGGSADTGTTEGGTTAGGATEGSTDTGSTDAGAGSTDAGSSSGH